MANFCEPTVPDVGTVLIPARLLCYLISGAENAKFGCGFKLPSLDAWVPGVPPGTTMRCRVAGLHGPAGFYDTLAGRKPAPSAARGLGERGIKR